MTPEHENGRGTNGTHAGLDLGRLFAHKKLIVVGGTGFLGKLWWSLLLSRYPGIGHIYLLVRAKGERNAERRFAEDIALNGALDPLRAEHGARFSEFLAEKVTPISGDVVLPYCGVSQQLRDEFRGAIAAVVNVSGIVDFEPPLDVSLQVNAFGVQNLVALARDLKGCPILHTSTCFVAGNRTGFIEEVDPRAHPFPRAGELERAHWDPDREIAECLDIIAQAKQRADDAFRQSFFWSEARNNLIRAHEPATGATLEREIERVRRKYVEARLAEMGNERARFWGWPNTYTYTKSIGEQIAAASGLPFTIVRPAIVESSLSYPMPGWNEGINTSAPLIYAIREGQSQLPGSTHNLDMIPCDMVASGIILALAELLEGSAPAVYQLGSSDSNPVTMARIFELSGLYKRKYHQSARASLLSFLQAHVEGALFSSADFQRYGPEAVARGARACGKLLHVAAKGPIAPLLGEAQGALERFARQQQRIARLLGRFAPFTADYDYTFRCDHARAAYARLGKEDKRRVSWAPESIDWRYWFLEVHVPGLERWVFPELDGRRERPPLAAKAHRTLPGLLEEMAERHDLACALSYTEPDGFSRISFREWHERSLACASRLMERGVAAGDAVLLLGHNHPTWAIALFGILHAGAVAVPLDPELDTAAIRRIAERTRATVLLGDGEARARLQPAPDGRFDVLDLFETTLSGDRPAAATQRATQPGDVAVLLHTRGTSGAPKAVPLSHHQLTSLVAALFPVFPFDSSDRILGALPLHQAFALTTSLLLPLARGARVVHVDRLDAERVLRVLGAAQISTLVAAPTFFETLTDALQTRRRSRGALVSGLLGRARDLNRKLAARTGVNLGHVLFAAEHRVLGGRLRYLISSGGPVTESTRRVLVGMGLELREGYGLTESASLLSVSSGGARAKPGAVGRAIPGVELRIESPDAQGYGEILARGPNVMTGYFSPISGAPRPVDAEGWLHTGDLGRLDAKGNLELAGRLEGSSVSSASESTPVFSAPTAFRSSSLS